MNNVQDDMVDGGIVDPASSPHELNYMQVSVTRHWRDLNKLTLFYILQVHALVIIIQEDQKWHKLEGQG